MSPNQNQRDKASEKDDHARHQIRSGASYNAGVPVGRNLTLRWVFASHSVDALLVAKTEEIAV